MLIKEDIKSLFKAIDRNCEYIKSKGCSITDPMRFVKIVIGRHYNLDYSEIEIILDEIVMDNLKGDMQ